MFINLRVSIKILCFIGITTLIYGQPSTIQKIDSINSIAYPFIVSNVKESIEIFTDNLKKAQEIGYSNGIAWANANLGLAYYIFGKYDKATSSYLTAINIFDELGQTEDLANTLGEFGYQLKRRDLSQANKYMKQGIKIAEENKYDSSLAKLYDNYGVLKEMESNLDSAKYFYNKSLNIKLSRNDSVGIPYSLNKLAGVHAMQGNYESALAIMNQSDAYRNKEDGEFGRIENLVLYGDIYKAKGDLNKAINYYETGLDKSIGEDINYLIRYCYQELTELYKIKGEYKKALESLNAYNTYKDSVLNKEVQLKVAELQINYETEKKDREIAENKLELSEKNAQLYLLIAATVFLMLVIFAVFVYQKRKREQLVLTNKLKQAELENKLSDEKLRISRELHDNIGSQLTFMISSIDNYVYKTNEKTEVLNNISEFGREALKELRNTIWALKHEVANAKELVIRINELIQRINSTIENVQIKIKNDIDNQILLSAAQMLNLYRITQEAVQNSIKHSGATEINIQFENHNNHLILSIADNGSGFEIESIEEGNGLESMRTRSKESNGDLQIESSDKGTIVKCIILVK